MTSSAECGWKQPKKVRPSLCIGIYFLHQSKFYEKDNSFLKFKPGVSMLNKLAQKLDQAAANAASIEQLIALNIE